MKRITSNEREAISQLRTKLGDRTFRQLMTGENSRLMRPERMRNLSRGSGKLSDSERQQLDKISRNSQSLSALQKRGSGKQEYKSNRAMRDWLNAGKQKGVDYDSQEKEVRDQQQKAIKALRYLGVDPSDGTFYVRKGRK